MTNLGNILGVEMSEQIKKIFGFIVVFIILFVFLDKGIDWWSEKKIIRENDERIAFAIENKNPQICSIVNNAISMANTVTNKGALDRYKKIAQEYYCDEASIERIKNSMGYKLISIAENGKDVPLNDPRISALNGKLEALSQQTGVPEKNIANISYYFKNKIKEDGFQSDIDELLEVIFIGVENKACNLKVEKTEECISSFLAMYTIARTKTNQDHQTAVHSLKSILDVANDPEKRAKLEAIINEH